jgi:hypothetical protein
MDLKIRELNLEATRAVIGGAVTFMATSVYQSTYVSLSASAPGALSPVTFKR